MKVLNRGEQIQFLPASEILTDEALPAACKGALGAWEESRTNRDEVRAALGRAIAAAQDEFVVFKESDAQRFAAEVNYRVRGERQALDAAQRAVTVAAKAVVETLSTEEHREARRAIGARLALEAYAVEVDATLDLVKARSRRMNVEPRTEPSPLVPEGRMSYGSPSAESRLAALDEVNAVALAEIAGDRCGLVEVEAREDKVFGMRLLTTPRRAALMVGTKNRTHGSTWTLVEDDEEVAR